MVQEETASIQRDKHDENGKMKRTLLREKVKKDLANRLPWTFKQHFGRMKRHPMLSVVYYNFLKYILDNHPSDLETSSRCFTELRKMFAEKVSEVEQGYVYSEVHLSMEQKILLNTVMDRIKHHDPSKDIYESLSCLLNKKFLSFMQLVIDNIFPDEKKMKNWEMHERTHHIEHVLPHLMRLIIILSF